MGEKKIYFRELDGLRFFAFIAVFLAHSFYTEQETLATHPLLVKVKSIAHLGIFGVNFFFVLSGFLITYLLLTEKHDLGNIRLGKFYLRRVLRIWPLYFLILGVGFWLVPSIQHLLGNSEYQETAKIWPYLLFINNFFPPPTTAVLGVLWSIAIEEQFYAFWPIFMRALPTKGILILVISTILLSAILRTFVIGWGYSHSLSCMSDLAVGSLLAWLCYFFPSHRDRIAKQLGSWHIILIYIIGGALFLFRHQLIGFSPYYLNERLLYSLFFAFVIFEQSFSPNSFYHTSSQPFLVKSGIISYGLYMLHFTAIYLVSKVFSRFHLDQELWQVLLLAPLLSLALSYALSWLSYHYFETPFLRLKRRFSPIKKA